MNLRANVQPLGRVLHAVSFYVVGIVALAMVIVTILSALGALPWLSLQAGFGETLFPQAGMVAQISLTLLLVAIAGFYPASSRVLALEQAHRDFRISMEDVANAYHMAHTADRKGVFTLSAQFDQVRERIDYLREHPDLKLLEADILTLAAQMSQQSHRLAEIYNDERVSRARDFLAQRQQEVQEQQSRISEAMGICREINRWNSQVELEEAVVASQLQQLDEILRSVLPSLGYSLDRSEEAQAVAQGQHAAMRPANVVPMGAKPAAE